MSMPGHRWLAAVAVALTALTLAVAGAYDAGAVAAGPAWTVAVVPGPDGAPLAPHGYSDPELDCASAAYCVLLSGDTYLTELVNDSTATVVAPVYDDSPGTGSYLLDVACSAPGRCVATGGYDHGPCCGSFGFRDELIDGTWTAEAGTEAHYGVACNVQRCVEIGTADVGIELGAIDDRQLGGGWVSRDLATPEQPDPGRGFYTTVDSVTCPRSGGCYALGFSRTGASDYDGHPVVLRRDGQVWRGVDQVLPAGAASGQLDDLSCPSAGRCIGIGRYAAAGGQRGGLFAATLDAGVWRAEPIARPASWRQATGVGSLTVACSSMTHCGALGSAYTGQGPLPGAFFAFDGATWTTQPVTSPGWAAGPATATDVSCGSDDRCLAVGKAALTAAPGSVTRAVTWVGTPSGWSARRSPLPADGAVAATDSVGWRKVECPASGRCVLVGDIDDGSSDVSIYGIRRFPG